LLQKLTPFQKNKQNKTKQKLHKVLVAIQMEFGSLTKPFKKAFYTKPFVSQLIQEYLGQNWTTHNCCISLSLIRALLKRRLQMELVVTVLASAYQEFPASLEALDLPDQQEHLAITDLRDPWAQEEIREIKALEEVKVLKVLRDLKDQPVHLETRVIQGLVEAKVPQVPKAPQVKWVYLETKAIQVLKAAKVPLAPWELLDH